MHTTTKTYETVWTLFICLSYYFLPPRGCLPHPPERLLELDADVEHSSESESKSSGWALFATVPYLPIRPSRIVARTRIKAQPIECIQSAWQKLSFED